MENMLISFIRKKSLEYSINSAEDSKLHVEITTTPACGVKCKYCPQELLRSSSSKDKNINNKVITLDRFKSYLKNFHDYPALSIHWTGYSEPCANKDFSAMSRHVADLKLEQEISTTLTGLPHNIDFIANNPSFFTAICLHLPDDSGLMEDGALQVDDSYLNVLIKFLDDFERSSRNNVKLWALTFGPCFHPQIEKILANKSHLFSGFSRHRTLSSRSSGVDALFFRKLWNKNKRFALLKRSLKEIYVFFKKIILLEIPLPAKKCVVKKFGSQPVVLGNGNVNICCHDYTLSQIICNVSHDNFYASLRKWRKSVLNDFSTGKLLPCKKCEFYKPLTLRDLLFKV